MSGGFCEVMVCAQWRVFRQMPDPHGRHTLPSLSLDPPISVDLKRHLHAFVLL
jgi:hypothetical protein